MTRRGRGGAATIGAEAAALHHRPMVVPPPASDRASARTHPASSTETTIPAGTFNYYSLLAMTFELVYDNQFSAPLGSEWVRYDGIPACCPTSKWDKENAVVQNGKLVLRGLRQPGGTYRTAGVSLPQLNMTYGRVRFRGRFDRGRGLKMCALLWPQTGFEPPEIDFAESRTEDAERTTMCMTLHYPPTAGDAIRGEIKTDFSQWHTWGLTWMPGHLSCTVDGKTWKVIEDAAVGKVVVPRTPMHFGVQTTMGSPGKAKPDTTTPDEVSLHIDSVTIWRYQP